MLPVALLPVLLLAAAIGVLVWFVRSDVSEYRLFKLLGDSRDRRVRYRLWVVRAVLAFATSTLVALALLGRMGALTRLPPEFDTLAAAVGYMPLDDGLLIGIFSGGLIGGVVIGTVWALLRKRRGRRGPMLGDVEPLLPRNRAELWHAALLSITAGVTEEMFFRLLLPLLVAVVTGSALAGFVVATLLFGAAHRYQGWVGVAATTAMGTLFAVVYLGTRSLFAAMALHAFVDLNGLVLRPLLTGSIRRT